MVTADDSTPLLGGDNDDKKDIPCLAKRHILAFMAFLGFVNVYALRVNLSVAIVAMANSSYSEIVNGSDECGGQQLNNTQPKAPTGDFNWDTDLQGIILGSFFYGYIIMQLPGGRLAEMFSAKLLFGFGVFCTAIFTLLTPLAANVSPYFLIALRILEGIGEAVTGPTIHAMMANWVPRYERTSLGAFIYSGAQMGTIISMPLSGLFSDVFGWESVFYIFGTLGCLWFFVWMYLISDTPQSHPTITDAEKMYLQQVISTDKKSKTAVPWMSIITSIHVWATLVAHVCFNWGNYTLLTSLPTFMKEVLHFDLSSNGLLSALPYVAQWLVIVSSSQLADYLRRNHYLTTTTARKLFNTLGLLLPGLALLPVGYLGCNEVWAITMIVLSGAFSGFASSGYLVNHLDLAAPYAGTLMGITNGAATIPGFVGPQVVGILTKSNPSSGQWQKVFVISAAIYAFGAFFFVIFGSGKQQPWATTEDLLPYVKAEEEEEYEDQQQNVAVDDVHQRGPGPARTSRTQSTNEIL